MQFEIGKIYRFAGRTWDCVNVVHSKKYIDNIARPENELPVTFVSLQALGGREMMFVERGTLEQIAKATKSARDSNID